MSIQKWEYYQAIRELGKYMGKTLDKGSEIDLETDRLQKIVSDFEKENFRELTLKEKQAKFLFDTVNHFNLINRGLRYPIGNCCSYEAGCAIGRHIKEKDIRKRMDEVTDLSGHPPLLWQFGETELHEGVFELMPKELRQLGNKFLRHVQELHDELMYWDVKGINNKGRQFLAQIIYHFKLQKEYTKLAYGINN